MTVYGAVEMGGTKIDMTVGTDITDMAEPVRIPTRDPDTTLAEIISFFAPRGVSAVGVASFGPLQLDRTRPRFGTVLFTPKPGWSGVAITDRLSADLEIPVVIDTDVNGAALGEGRWGATQGMTHHVYVTVGTGVGAGIVVSGQLIGGRNHPEFGHIAVNRRGDDRHEGSCPYHGACLEGMAAGPSLQARFGRWETWAGNDLVLDTATHYLAQGMVGLVYTVSPERIVVGGGVSKTPGFHERLRERLETALAGYPETFDLDLLIAKPGLGDGSGLAGALLLAAEAEV